MILYNVTLKVDPQIHEEWKQWMCEVHIPDVMSTGLFKEYKMCKLLGLDEEDGKLIPRASIADDMVLAVYIPPHAPGPGIEFLMIPL